MYIVQAYIRILMRIHKYNTKFIPNTTQEMQNVWVPVTLPSESF